MPVDFLAVLTFLPAAAPAAGSGALRFGGVFLRTKVDLAAIFLVRGGSSSPRCGNGLDDLPNEAASAAGFFSAAAAPGPADDDAAADDDPTAADSAAGVGLDGAGLGSAASPAFAAAAGGFGSAGGFGGMKIFLDFVVGAVVHFLTDSLTFSSFLALSAIPEPRRIDLGLLLAAAVPAEEIADPAVPLAAKLLAGGGFGAAGAKPGSATEGLAFNAGGGGGGDAAAVDASSVAEVDIVRSVFAIVGNSRKQSRFGSQNKCKERIVLFGGSAAALLSLRTINKLFAVQSNHEYKSYNSNGGPNTRH